MTAPNQIRCLTDPTGIRLSCKVMIPSAPDFKEDWIMFKVDTGSQSTRVGEKDATKLGFNFSAFRKNGTGSVGAGVGVSEDYTVPGSYLVLRDKSNMEIKAFLDRGIVFERKSDKNLLGWDFLRKNKFTYDGEDFVIEV